MTDTRAVPLGFHYVAHGAGYALLRRAAPGIAALAGTPVAAYAEFRESAGQPA
jgi:hypothetical protein